MHGIPWMSEEKIYVKSRYASAKSWVNQEHSTTIKDTGLFFPLQKKGKRSDDSCWYNCIPSKHVVLGVFSEISYFDTANIDGKSSLVHYMKHSVFFFNVHILQHNTYTYKFQGSNSEKLPIQYILESKNTACFRELIESQFLETMLNMQFEENTGMV